MFFFNIDLYNLFECQENNRFIYPFNAGVVNYSKKDFLSSMCVSLFFIPVLDRSLTFLNFFFCFNVEIMFLSFVGKIPRQKRKIDEIFRNEKFVLKISLGLIKTLKQLLHCQFSFFWIFHFSVAGWFHSINILNICFFNNIERRFEKRQGRIPN